MLKRRPYIAFIVFFIALAGVIWAVWTISRYLFYNPIELVRTADIPSESLNAPRFEFTEIESSSVPDELSAVRIQPPSQIQTSRTDDSYFSSLREREDSYMLRARTRSAFDPVKDEKLRGMLSELLKIRQDDEKARLELAKSIYKELLDTAGDSSFRAALFETLMRNTLRSSMENPDLYPLRLAEVKSDYYKSLMDDAVIVLSRYDEAFKKAIDERFNSLREKQDKDDEARIFEIRDYLLAKTSNIESEVHNGNGQDGDSE